MNGNRVNVEFVGLMGLPLRKEPSQGCEAPQARAAAGKTVGGELSLAFPALSPLEGARGGDLLLGPSSGTEPAKQPRRAASITRLTDLPHRRWVLRLPAWKRPLDLVVALGLMLLTLPVWVLAALLIKLTSRGPVFYRQERLGLGMKPFQMYKFRTMRANADPKQHQQHVEQLQRQGRALEKLDVDKDDRITAVGRYLRLSSLDELPQLLNVLRGEMSMVGPRPCIAYEVASYKPWYFHRFECLPGLTGLWQVSGKNRLTADQMMRLDIRYARTQSLRGDLGIMWRTPRVIGQELWAGYRRWRQRRATRRTPVPAPLIGPTVPPPCTLSDSA